MFFSFLSYGQLSDILVNNEIGLSKEQILQMKKKGDIYPDTLNGVNYDVIKSSSGKILERFYLTNVENKNDTQHCFHYRAILVTTFFPYEKVKDILDVNFKKQRNHWIQTKKTYTIIWTAQLKEYLITLDAHKQ
jgi:hypothetical protein